MDARKALFRSRLRQAAERKERIDSPLVRYNDLGQPVCKVCNVSIKTEALWGAHLSSRQHKEAAEELKERAKRLAAAKKNDTENATSSAEPTATSTRSPEDQLSVPASMPSEDQQSKQATSGGQKRKTEDEEATPAKPSVLPQGFFDNEHADMKARGLEPPKVNLQEEMKEFQKLIEEDVKAVDDRYVQEEAEAAEIRLEEEEFLQSISMERVEMLKRRKLELGDTKTKPKPNSEPIKEDTENLLDDLSSEDESDDNLVMDWRARHL